MALAVGQMIFTKELTTTDIEHRLHWPSEYLTVLPDFNNNHHVKFSGRDASGNLWTFRCSKRATGPYGKPVVARGWLSFLKSRGVELNVGDELIVYRTIQDPESHFEIRFKKKVMLFGSNINNAEI